MAGRGGSSSREEVGCGSVRGGRGTPGRGGRSGGFAGTPPPPPPPGVGRGGRGPSPRAGVGFTPAGGRAGRSPYQASAGSGNGRGRGGSVPGWQPSFNRSPSGSSSSAAATGGGGRGYAGSPGGGRGYAGSPGGGRGYAGTPGVNQSAAFAPAGGGVGGGKLFGRGLEAVAFDRDKERGLLKVGTPAGQRFSAAWLRGLSIFVDWKGQQPAEQAQQGHQRQSQGQTAAAAATPAPPLLLPPPPPPLGPLLPQQQAGDSPAASAGQNGALPVTAERLSTPARPPETAELSPAALCSLDGTEALATEASTGAGLEEGNVEVEAATEATVGGAVAGPEAAVSGALAGLEAAVACAAAPQDAAVAAGDAAMVPAADASQRGVETSDLSRSSSGSSSASDLGWASVLCEAAAATASGATCELGASPGSSNSSTAGMHASRAARPAGACGAAGDEEEEVSSSGAFGASTPGSGVGLGSAGECSPSTRRWWPVSEPSLETAQPVAVERRLPGAGASPAGAAARGGSGGARVQLSLRLERQGLTDREAGMLADWCCENRDRADVRKLWLFDNRLSDVGAEAVARILAAHPQMQEVHLSHNMLTLQGAAALLEALPVAAPAAAPAAPAGIEAESEGAAAGAAEAAERPAEEAAAGEAGGSLAVLGAAVSGAAVPSAAALPSKPCWLRLEWNRISLEGLMQVLEAQHEQRGLVVDLPAPVRADAMPSLPRLPPYLAAAAAAAPATPTPVPSSRAGRNSLQYQVEQCHARLPWISCQYQLPSEAEVLKAARRGWQRQPAQQQQQQQPAQQQQRQQPEAPSAARNSGSSSNSQAGEESAHAASSATQAEVALSPAATSAAGAGPLLLFPDTSALLPMLGAGPGVSIPTFFTLDLLGQLAQQGRFGRALPPSEQVFVVVTDSVLKQLDGLKNDPAARPAVRRFLGQGLDAFGPAGADFLTVLGAHEGEGLLMEHDAAVSGSRSADVGTKGQRADHKIVEVALFFQQEVLRGSEAAGGPAEAEAEAGGPAGASEGIGAAAGAPNGGRHGSGQLGPACFPVLLLTGDNAQAQTARSHGLPAARMTDVAVVQQRLEAALKLGQGQGALTASLLREALGAAATTGLATAAGRSLQAEFDEAVAALAAATDALAATQQQVQAAAAAAAAGGEGTLDPAAALAAVQHALAGAASVTGGSSGRDGGNVGQLLSALRARVVEWQSRVRSHQDPSRLLRWAASL